MDTQRSTMCHSDSAYLVERAVQAFGGLRAAARATGINRASLLRWSAGLHRPHKHLEAALERMVSAKERGEAFKPYVSGGVWKVEEADELPELEKAVQTLRKKLGVTLSSLKEISKDASAFADAQPEEFRLNLLANLVVYVERRRKQQGRKLD